MPDDGAPGSGGRGWWRRRATLRPDLRAAMALEEAGELLEAARVFEYAGEHAQAALLRLEIARTLRDRAERIDVLREGCARSPGSSPEARLLHLALAESLLAEVDITADAAGRRAHQLEAARALEEADEGGRAGELYEDLGLLARAAAAYERGGEIARLELVLAVLEHKEHQGASLRALEHEVDHALAEGRRGHAHELLLEHVRERRHHGLAPVPTLATRLERLERGLARGDRIELRWGSAGGRMHQTSIRAADRFRIGRAPDAQLVLPAAVLSRHHVELVLDATGERTRLMAIDLGSKIGSFLDGDPLPTGEPVPIDAAASIGLGAAASASVVPLQGADGHVRGAVLRVAGDAREHVWLPQGGPLWLSSEIAVPARVLFDRGYVVLDFRGGVRARLADHELPAGATVELVTGDRIALVDAPLVLEVIG